MQRRCGNTSIGGASDTSTVASDAWLGANSIGADGAKPRPDNTNRGPCYHLVVCGSS
jgi:hypothetical protein